MDESSPRFRQDLVASATEADGVPCVDVSDPKTGTKFRFYDFEYQLALQLKGQPIGEVTSWASTAYGVDLTADGIAEFAGRLAELGFLEPRPLEAAPAAEITDTSGSASEALDSAEAEWMAPEAAKTAQFVPDFAMLASSPDRTPVAPELPILDTLEAAERPSAPRPAAITSPAATPSPPPPPSAPTSPGRAASVGPTATPSASATPSAGPKPGASPKPAQGPAVSVAVTRPSEAPTVRLPPMERSIAFTRPTDAPTVPSIPSALGTPDAAPKGGGTVGTSASAPDAAAGKSAAPAGVAPRWALDLDGTLGGAPAVEAAPSPGGKAPAAPSPSALAGAPPRVTAAPTGVAERRQPPMPEAVVMAGFTDDGKSVAPKAAAKRPARAVIVVLLLLAAVVIGYFAWAQSRPAAPHALRVRVLSPKPAAVYRWFSGRGVVVEDEARTLGFEAAGRLAELLPAGTEFGAGEILGRLQGSADIETLLAHHRSRLAFYAQMRDSMGAIGNVAEAHQAELRLAEKRRLVEETTAELARVTLRSKEPGEVVETLSKVGMLVKPGAPIARIKGRLLHGEFSLEGDELDGAGKLGFCRVEVIGLGPRASNAERRRATDPVADSGSPEAQSGPRFIDCTSPTRAGDKLTVALPGDLGLVPGQPLRLARQRYDAVFPIPASALLGDDGHRSVWVASRAGTAERREVTVAGLGDDALVSDGIRVGDDVIVEAPAGLAPGAAVDTTR